MFFRGNDSDFNQNWYTSMGDTIVGSMKFNIWFPVAMEFGYWGMRLAYRLRDYLKAPEGFNTSSQSIQQYINLYAGPQYFMHYKYSSIMNIVFITFMFGPGLPLLFPIAAASLAVFFCLEKYMLYYVFKQPPAYDEKLNNSVLTNLQFAPFFLLGFGYWMLTNQQLLSNDFLTPVGRKSEPFLAGHVWYRAITPRGVFNSGPAGMLLICFFGYAGYLLFRGPFYYLLSFCCSSMVVRDFEVDEEIEFYQNTLDGEDKEWTLAEERNMNKYGISTLLPTTVRSYEEGKFNEKYHLQGIHTYDILRNPIYAQLFQYFAADLDDRIDYIIDGDDDTTNDCA
jgi:hypothetical protein